MNRVHHSHPLREHARLDSLDADYRAAVTSGRTETVAFLVDRGYAAAVIIALQRVNGRVAVALLEDYAANAALDVISDTVARIEDGTLAPASIGSLKAYLTGATRQTADGPGRVRLPRQIAEFGYPGMLLFKLVVERRVDPVQAVVQVAQDFPHLAGTIRNRCLPVVLSYLAPGARPTAAVRRDVEARLPLDVAESYGSDMPDPLETTLRTLARDVVREVVASLPKPERTYATAYYLEETCQTHADLARLYQLRDREEAKYAMRKVRNELRIRLENLL